MNARTLRIAMTFVLVLLGVGLLTYGVSFHGATIEAQTGADGTAVAQSEPALIKEVTIGGLKRDASGEVKKTYTGDQAPPACPT
ncbi:MAG: hypothetical protein JW993_15980 [Sedimentisphaerales bacterium]|nr:hypothetical protein [Sedimentisphaerales bacterium]